MRCFSRKRVGRESQGRDIQVFASHCGIAFLINHRLFSCWLHRRCLRTLATPTVLAVPLRPPPMVTVPIKRRAEPKARWVMFCAYFEMDARGGFVFFETGGRCGLFFCVVAFRVYASASSSGVIDFWIQAHITNELRYYAGHIGCIHLFSTM